MTGRVLFPLAMALWLAALVFVAPAAAVDGYKHLKFGADRSQVLNSNLCALVEGTPIGPGVELISCSDFPFGGKPRAGGFFLVNGEFRRLIVALPAELEVDVLEGLQLKYGPPAPTVGAADSPEQASMIPVAFFSDGTVRLYRKPSGSLLLMYASAGFDRYFDTTTGEGVRGLLNDL